MIKINKICPWYVYRKGKRPSMKTAKQSQGRLYQRSRKMCSNLTFSKIIYDPPKIFSVLQICSQKKILKK